MQRGYGGDESIVHKTLNPDVPVFVSADRAQGISMAARSGAQAVVLDDAFQHRRASRDVDIVLISADDWTSSHRLLPAGPYREPLSALRRASAKNPKVGIATWHTQGFNQRDELVCEFLRSNRFNRRADADGKATGKEA